MTNNRIKALGLACLIAFPVSVCAAGKIKGSAGGHERGAIAWSSDGKMVGWTVTGPSGLYEFGGLEPGAYTVYLSGTIAPGVQVVEGRTTIVDQAGQPKLALEKELWTPSRVSFAQSFIARGTAVTGFSMWRASGNSKFKVSLYENDLQGKLIAGPYETDKKVTWIGGAGLPADQFVTEPGKTYVLRLEASDGEPWNHGAPRRGDVYADGIAYFDDVPHPESDLGITINERIPDLMTIASASDDLHFIKEGPGSGTCVVAGQTFIANTDNVVRAYANCGWPTGFAEFVFVIRKDGPDGEQVGPARHTKMVPNWGSDVIWSPGEVRLVPGEKYYLEYRRVDGEPFFSYLSSNVYADGRAYRDGTILDEKFDQLFKMRGEVEIGGLIFPYNVRVSNITPTTARITWQTGTQGDSLVNYGQTSHLNQQQKFPDRRTTEHEVVLEDLQPGTVYRYRVASDTYKKSSRRMFSRVYEFMTQPAGVDAPRFDRPMTTSAIADCADCLPMVNPSFEEGVKGWTRIAKSGRAKEPETYIPDAKPFGQAGPGVDGYEPVEGSKHYGWSYFGHEDPTWKEPREDWKSELITQPVAVEPGRKYALTVWILTGDRECGWGRNSRVRLVVDETDTDRLASFDTADQANVTQWFATEHDWIPITLEFQAKAKRAVVGVEFLHWWALQTTHLYIDHASVRPLD